LQQNTFNNNWGLVGFAALVLVGQQSHMLVPNPNDELYSTMKAS